MTGLRNPVDPLQLILLFRSAEVPHCLRAFLNRVRGSLAVRVRLVRFVDLRISFV